MQTSKIIALLFVILVTVPTVFSQSGKSTVKIKALIVDGQNNHEEWPKLTYILKKEMEATGLFSVDVNRSAYTWKGDEFLEEFAIDGLPQTEAMDDPKTDPDFRPNFAEYDVIINNFGWNAAPWPKKTRKRLEKYMKKRRRIGRFSRSRQFISAVGSL